MNARYMGLGMVFMQPATIMFFATQVAREIVECNRALYF
jgi:hypothetical protein